MLVDLIPYAVLVSVFIVTGLGVLIGKPNRLSHLAVLRAKRKRIDKSSSIDA